MAKMHVVKISPQQIQDIRVALIYQGLLPAIRLYAQYTGCRLEEAKSAVEKIGQEIEPGPA